MSGPLHASSEIPVSIRPETILYHAGDVWITTTRLVVGHRTYWLPDIHSLDVSVVSKGPLLLPALYFIPIPIIFVLIWIQADSNATWFGQILRVSAFVALAVILVLAAFAFFRRGSRVVEPARYVIRLNGKDTIYTSTDGDYALWLARQVARAREGTGSVEGYYPASPEMGQGEYVYYSDDVVAITSKQIIFGKESFPLAAIKSAHVSQSPPAEYTQRWSLALAFMALNSMLSIIRQNSPNFGRDLSLLWPGDFRIASDVVLVAVLVTMGWTFWRLSSSSYAVRLQGNFGDARWVEVFATFNEAYAKTLTNNINSTTRASKTDIYANNATVPS